MRPSGHSLTHRAPREQGQGVPARPCHQWDTHDPWRAGSPGGEPPEQPEPRCWVPASPCAGAWQGVRAGLQGHGTAPPFHMTPRLTAQLRARTKWTQGNSTPSPTAWPAASWGCCACKPPPNPSARPPQPLQHESLCTWALSSVPLPPEASPAKGWGRGTHGTESAVPWGRAQPPLCPQGGFLEAVCSRQSMPAAPALARRSARGRVTLTQLAAPAAPETWPPGPEAGNREQGGVRQHNGNGHRGNQAVPKAEAGLGLVAPGRDTLLVRAPEQGEAHGAESLRHPTHTAPCSVSPQQHHPQSGAACSDPTAPVHLCPHSRLHGSRSAFLRPAGMLPVAKPLHPPRPQPQGSHGRPLTAGDSGTWGQCHRSPHTNTSQGSTTTCSPMGLPPHAPGMRHLSPGSRGCIYEHKVAMGL